MNRIMIVNQKQEVLAEKVAHLMPQAHIRQNFKWQPQSGDVICWLTNDKLRVDQEVNEMVTMLDHWHAHPAKIVMKSVAGTADDATKQQLTEWYGADGRQLVADHLYAIKMIDELEFPYTIVRTLPLTDQQVHRELTAEGQPMVGQFSNIDNVAQVIAKACSPDQFRNVSIGI